MNKEKSSSVLNVARLDELPARPIEKDEYIELWQYFSDRADTLKDKLWTIATWLLALAGGLLAFTFSQEFVLFAPAGLSARQPLPALALACAGILVCLFSFLVIDDYGKHIQRNWDRAGVVKDKIMPLEAILQARSKETKQKPGQKKRRLPRICYYLLAIVAGYLVIFALIAILAAVSSLSSLISAAINSGAW